VISPRPEWLFQLITPLATRVLYGRKRRPPPIRACHRGSNPVNPHIVVGRLEAGCNCEFLTNAFHSRRASHPSVGFGSDTRRVVGSRTPDAACHMLRAPPGELHPCVAPPQLSPDCSGGWWGDGDTALGTIDMGREEKPNKVFVFSGRSKFLFFAISHQPHWQHCNARARFNFF
jgi:hypothetical protein